MNAAAGQPQQPLGAEPTIDELIVTANANLAIITNAFGENGRNLTTVLQRNQNISNELENITALIQVIEAQINDLITQLSNAKTDEDFNNLDRNFRAFLTNFNQTIPLLGIDRLNADIGQDVIANARILLQNIRNTAFAYVIKGPNYRGSPEQFTQASNLVKGIYVVEGNGGLVYKNSSNNTIIRFEIDGGVFVPTNVIIQNVNNPVVKQGRNFTTTIEGNPYILVAYAYVNIPLPNPQAAANQGQANQGQANQGQANQGQANPGGGSKRKRRRTRKNKRKSKAKKQKGGFGYNNKIPSSKKKSSKRKTSSNTNTTTTSSSKSSR